jgi:predicted lipid-binding transport protein (Tim44 family)
MRKTAMLVLFALLAVAMGLSQQPASANSNQSTAPQTQNGNNTTAAPDQPATDQNNASSGFSQRSAASGDVPANTEMRATLDTPLSSKTSKPGDRFTATVSQPVQGRNGEVIPTGARVEGEVSESEQGKTIPALRGKGKLNLRFRDIVLPNGQTVPLIASLVSVNSTNGKRTQKADNEGQVESDTQGKTVAKDVGIGAGVGTIAGLIFGGPLKGLAIGTLAGGGYVLATNGKDVNLPAQTGLVIRLDQGLSVQ